MSEIKVVIALLCKHLRQAVDATLKPEHLRLAKFNKSTNDTVIELWKVLYQLSLCALNEIPGGILINVYDEVTTVKLYFAYLQYAVPQFYGLSLDSQDASRELLLAFSWLLATQNVLTIAIDKQIAKSNSVREFSDNDQPEAIPINLDKRLSTTAQLNTIIHTSGRISNNVRAIAELTDEKVKLLTKAHAASLNVCGLPHLSISEIGMMKRIAVEKSVANDHHMHNLHKLASVLDTHAKWEARRHIFFSWMSSVIQEHKVSQVAAVSSKDIDCELARFVCLMGQIVKQNLDTSKNIDKTSSNSPLRSDCVLRLLRTQSNYSETGMWISEMKQLLENEEKTVKENTDCLATNLKKILRSIPHSVKV